MFLCSDYTWRQNRNLNLPETNKRGSSQKPLISAAREHQKLNSRGFWTRKQRKQFNCGEEHSSRVRLLRFESWLHHFPAVWSLASDLAFLCLGFCQTWIMMELQYISYLWLCNKLPPSCVPHNNKPLLSHSFCGSGIWKGLRWVLLAQGCSLGDSQDVNWGSCHTELWLRLEDHLQRWLTQVACGRRP